MSFSSVTPCIPEPTPTPPLPELLSPAPRHAIIIERKYAMKERKEKGNWCSQKIVYRDKT